MTQFTRVVCLTLCSAVLAAGQDQDSLKQRPGQLSVEDVVALVEAGLGDDVVVEKLRQNATAFDLSVDQLLSLQNAGVSSEIIKAMINPAAGTGASGGSGSAQARDPNWPPDIPDELGLYTRTDGKVTQLEPEVVAWKARGRLMSFATSGLVGDHKNGVVKGRNSRYQVSMPSEVFIVVPEGASANEYQCVSMRQKNKQREFRISTAGTVMEGSADKNFVQFEAQKVASRLYRIELTELEPGEYGFVPPGATMQASMGSVGKIYSFGVE